MVSTNDILETIKMIQEENLDIRTITMGISLLDCIDSDIDRACEKVYEKMMRVAENHVKTGEEIEKRYGIPIINKRLSVTPIAILAAAAKGSPVKFAKTLQRVAEGTGVNYIGGYSALVQGLCGRGYGAYKVNSRSIGGNLQRLLLGKRRLYQSGHKYGRSKAYGTNNRGQRKDYRRRPLLRRRKNSGILQCG